MKVNSDDLSKRITTAESDARAALDQQNAILDEIRDKIEENKRLISEGKSMAIKMWERWQWITQLGADLKDYMMVVLQSNLAIYREVVMIRKHVATAPGWALAEDPFLLEDAVGRVAPVHLRFITSWIAFEAVLEARFEGRKGFSKVRRGDYVLQEDSTEKEVDREMDWDLAFMPGQKINMSLVFRREQQIERMGTSDDSAVCPHCQEVNSGSPDQNVQW